MSIHKSNSKFCNYFYVLPISSCELRSLPSITLHVLHSQFITEIKRLNSFDFVSTSSLRMIIYITVEFSNVHRFWAIAFNVQPDVFCGTCLYYCIDKSKIVKDHLEMLLLWQSFPNSVEIWQKEKRNRIMSVKEKKNTVCISCWIILKSYWTIYC